jgi:hypothetical protein
MNSIIAPHPLKYQFLPRSSFDPHYEHREENHHTGKLVISV